MDDICVTIFHLSNDFRAKSWDFFLSWNASGELFQLRSELIHAFEGLRELVIDFLGVTCHNFNVSFNLYQFSYATWTHRGIFFIGWAENARNVVSSHFVKLKVDSNGVSGKVVSWDVVIRSKFAKLFFWTMLVIVV